MQPLRQTPRLADGLPRSREALLLRGYAPPLSAEDPFPLQEARTDFRVLARFPPAPDALPYATALVQATPLTCRYQQVRKHLKLNNHRVLGERSDPQLSAHRRNQAAKERLGLDRIFIHAAAVSLSGRALKAAGMKPGDAPLLVTAPLPPELRRVVERLPGWPAAEEALRERGLLAADDDGLDDSV